MFCIPIVLVVRPELIIRRNMHELVWYFLFLSFMYIQLSNAGFFFVTRTFIKTITQFIYEN